MIQAPGRMIRKDISDSRGYASLSGNAAKLLTMIIANLNPHGKMNGGPGFIKDEICPRVKEFTQENIPNLLREISRKTNIKYFKKSGRYWIHSTKFLTDHQDIRKDRLGKDLLPSYSGSTPGLTGTTPGLLPHEVEVEGKVEEEGKGEVEGNGVANTTPNPMRGGLSDILS